MSLSPDVAAKMSAVCLATIQSCVDAMYDRMAKRRRFLVIADRKSADGREVIVVLGRWNEHLPVVHVGSETVTPSFRCIDIIRPEELSAACVPHDFARLLQVRAELEALPGVEDLRVVDIHDVLKPRLEIASTMYQTLRNAPSSN